jgi:ABC-type multidrug transport system fused ATPase/permease subunit
MFSPEFRVMFTQEANNEIMLFDNQYISLQIIMFVVGVLVMFSLGWLGYLLLLLVSQLTTYGWTLLWNSLTPGNELIELILIVTSLVAAGFMFSAMKGLSELIDNKFRKLKNENQIKDARIKALEAELDSKIQIITELEETDEQTEKKANNKEKETLQAELYKKKQLICDLQNKIFCLEGELEKKNYLIYDLRYNIYSLEYKLSEQEFIKNIESKVEETKVEEAIVEEAKVEETKVEETKVEETKVEEAKVEETKVEEAKVEDVKEEDEEPEVVKKIKFEGIAYLKSKKTGVIYDYEKYKKEGEAIQIGMWNDVLNKIDFYEEE